MNLKRIAGVTGACLLLIAAIVGQDTERRRGGGGGGRRDQQREAAVFRTEVPKHDFDIVIGRPTSNSVVVSVLTYADAEGAIAYGQRKEKLESITPATKFKAREPVEITLKGLAPATACYFEFRYRSAGAEKPAVSELYSVVTARPSGAEFTFAIQADSHLDEGTDTDTYRRSILNAGKSGADFLVDLGDTFMTDKYPNFRDAEAQYYAQRYYFGLLGRPVFLALGNHDGETGWRSSGGDDMQSWSNSLRRKLFPNPVPDAFFSGPSKPDPKRGYLQNYYGYEWGDALFIVLDPFTYTESRARDGDGWNWTLGREQYDWLRATLAKSKARYKFVFIHHLVGGADRNARGGTEAAAFWEWGGKGFDLEKIFGDRRGGWELPIHDLLVRNKVSAVFHGHDHLFVKQDLDGIVYQEVPQPGHRRADNTRSAEEYGYKSGVIKGSSGILVVRVSAKSAQVSYVRAFPDARESKGREDGSVDFTYEIAPSKN